MKNLKLFLSIALALIISNSAFAQGRVGGRVVEVIDGKTVVIEMQNLSRLTAELQYIEVPEIGQPLNQTVKDHLRELVEGKIVEFKAKGLRKTNTVGQLFLNGVDISQQMIRDGAAWHAGLNKSGQDTVESAVYQSNEAQAKREKRGIWSIENLKPSWEIRAEAEENRRREEKLAAEKLAQEAAAKSAAQAIIKPLKPKARPQMSSEAAMWNQAPDANEKMPENFSNVGGLMVGYNPNSKIGIVATPLLKLAVPDKDIIQAIGIGIGYFYHNDESKGREFFYIIAVESDSKEFRFLKSNDLIVTADNQKIVVGKAKRYARQNGSLVKETLYYEVKRSVIAKISAAKSVNIKAGTYSTNLNSDIQMLLKNFINASE
ncbi:MAG: thermonuclease family protein [Acidobacteriota bacterium]|nr:thermonuclease family protein [Acidobacteriota bacterium]